MSDRTKASLTLLVVIALLCPQRVNAQGGDIADGTTEVNLPLQEVEIGADGIVRGVVLNNAGHPVAGVAVEFHQHDGVIHARSDESGRLAVPGLTGGNCLINVSSAVYVSRLWMHRTAPPSAVGQFTIVDPRDPASSLPSYEVPADTGALARYNPRSRRHIALFGLLAAGITAGVVVAAQDDAADASQ